MSTTPVRTTELDAVNTMLGVIGESPVNSLGGDANVDVALAKQILLETSKEVQSEEWHFNRESDYPLTPNQDKEILVATNCIAVDADKESGVDVVLRGNKLYDKKGRTFQFEDSIEVEIVWLLPFDEIPEAIQRYITVRAARAFQDRVVGSDTLHGFNEKDELRARVRAQAADSESGDYNILNTLSVGRVMWRGAVRPGG